MRSSITSWFIVIFFIIYFLISTSACVYLNDLDNTLRIALVALVISFFALLGQIASCIGQLKNAVAAKKSAVATIEMAKIEKILADERINLYRPGFTIYRESINAKIVSDRDYKCKFEIKIPIYNNREVNCGISVVYLNLFIEDIDISDNYILSIITTKNGESNKINGDFGFEVEPTDEDYFGYFYTEDRFTIERFNSKTVIFEYRGNIKNLERIDLKIISVSGQKETLKNIYFRKLYAG